MKHNQSPVPKLEDFSVTRSECSAPLLSTPKEIADLLRVSPKTIYYWVKRNEIPFIRVGRHLRFNTQMVLDWLTAKTEDSKAACFQRSSTIQRDRFSRSLKTWNAGHPHKQ